MREGPNGEGYLEYTKYKDAVAGGEIDPDADNYASEVYLTHYNKQCKNFRKQKEARERQKHREKEAAIQIAQVFMYPESFDILQSLREYYKNVSPNLSGFMYVGESNLGSEALNELTEKIKELYMYSSLITCPDRDFVRHSIEEKVKLGNRFLLETRN